MLKIKPNCPYCKVPINMNSVFSLKDRLKLRTAEIAIVAERTIKESVRMSMATGIASTIGTRVTG